jgi:hypothetical protein
VPKRDERVIGFVERSLLRRFYPNEDRKCGATLGCDEPTQTTNSLPLPFFLVIFGQAKKSNSSCRRESLAVA